MRILTFAVLLAIAPLLVPAQQPSAGPGPHFDAATVRENVSRSDSTLISSASPDRLTITNIPLKFILLYAYDLPDHRLRGLPSWAEDRTYDINAVYPTQSPGKAEIQLMLQQLVTERFRLQTHHEQKVMPAFDLEFAHTDRHLGPQLVQSDQACPQPPNSTAPAGKNKFPPSPFSTVPVCTIFANRRHLRGGAATVENLTLILQSMVDRPIVDKTGLHGRFDIALDWSQAETPESTATDSQYLFPALSDQLGLKLVPRKETFDVLVVDHVERPIPE